ncbi:conserved hypothetical protein [Microsporum canis CBS 113480]|uniref:Homeobox transcription factor n=1 Tax=Arthroderma otae (strain ATCC MYA-4605 / CBS 113480) TaxID=554155 RepID=C5FFN9_ARTOC|nr:conserved hypothetical protein [Microsporum canis CBS 113480]EEQ29486.1 conserved hypothetical protein [Microsporum canis CBS 113480]
MSIHEVYAGIPGWTNTRVEDQSPSSQLHNYHSSAMIMQFSGSSVSESLKQEPLISEKGPDVTMGQCDIRGLAYLKAAEQEHSSQDPSDNCYMGSHKGSQGNLSCSDLTDAVQSSSASSCPGSPQTPVDTEQQNDRGNINSKQGMYSPVTEDAEIHDVEDESKGANEEKIDRKKMKRFRRAKLKRLSLDDRERVLKSRALPDDFDMAQSLQSSYAPEHHGYTTPLVSPGTFFPPEENDPYNSGRVGTSSGDDYTTSPLSTVSAYSSYFGRGSSTFSRGTDSISSMSTSGDSLGSFASISSANPSIHGRVNFIPRSFGEQQGTMRPSVPQLHMYNTSVRARTGSLNLPLRGPIPCPTPPLEYTDTDSSVDLNSTYGSRSLDASARRDPFGLGSVTEGFKQKTVGQSVTTTPRLGEGSPPKVGQSRAGAAALQSSPLSSTQEEDQLSGLGPHFNLSSFGITYSRQNPSSNTNDPSHPSKRPDMQGAYNQHGTAWLQQTIQQKLSCYPTPEFSAPRQRAFFYQPNTETI